MYFATLTPIMSIQKENPIPQARTPRFDERIPTAPDPIRNFLETDPAWEDLRPDFQTLVSETAHEVYNLDTNSLSRQAKELDAQASKHPYLQTAVSKEGSLSMISHVMNDIFTEPLFFEDTISTMHSPEKTLRIILSGRLLGQRIAEKFGWNREQEFGVHQKTATIAIDLCTRALKDIPPKKI